jgi:hypothetical protein
VVTWWFYDVGGCLPVHAPLYGPSDKFKPTEDKVISKKNNLTMKINLLFMF